MAAEQTYRLGGSGVASEHFEDEIILINLPRGNYYSLRHTAFELWQRLLDGATQSRMVGFLNGRYGVDRSTAAGDVAAFVGQLLDEGLIAPVDAPATPFAESQTTPSSFSYTKPELEVYTDMQDLLMLDPIHDVDSEQGWPIKK